MDISASGLTASFLIREADDDPRGRLDYGIHGTSR
jgi:hypothetical protein